MALSLKAQIANLQRKLAKIDVASGNNNNTKASGPRNKTVRRRARRNNRTASIPGNPIAPVAVQTNPRKMRRGGGNIPPLGTIRIRRKEFLATIKAENPKAPSTGYIPMLPEKFPWLSKLSKSFDRIKWHSLTVFWKSAMGTTESGMVTLAMDWDSDFPGVLLTQDYINGLSPIYESPVWQSGVFNVPSSRLMTRKEYKIRPGEDKTDQYDVQPGLLCWCLTSAVDKSAGNLWIEYDVTMFGTNSS